MLSGTSNASENRTSDQSVDVVRLGADDRSNNGEGLASNEKLSATDDIANAANDQEKNTRDQSETNGDKINIGGGTNISIDNGENVDLGMLVRAASLVVTDPLTGIA